MQLSIILKGSCFIPLTLPPCVQLCLSPLFEMLFDLPHHFFLFVNQFVHKITFFSVTSETLITTIRIGHLLIQLKNCRNCLNCSVYLKTILKLERICWHLYDIFCYDIMIFTFVKAFSFNSTTQMDICLKSNNV